MIISEHCDGDGSNRTVMSVTC